MIKPTGLPSNNGNASFLRPQTVESLIFGYPDQTVTYIEKILPVLEKASLHTASVASGLC